MTDKHRDQQCSVQTTHDKSVQKYIVQRLLWHNTWNTQERLEWADWWISMAFKSSQLWQLHQGEDEKGGGGVRRSEGGREREGGRKRGEKERGEERQKKMDRERVREIEMERGEGEMQGGGGGGGGGGGERDRDRERRKENINKPSDHPTWAFFFLNPISLQKKKRNCWHDFSSWSNKKPSLHHA